MDSELNAILSKDFVRNINRKYLNYKGSFMLDTYEDIADAIENFKVRDDDVWVRSFPRSGTTWAQEMIWTIANGVNSKEAEISITERFSYLEHPGSSILWNEVYASGKANPKRARLEYVENIANLPSPRFIKTHLPFHLLPRQLREREKNCKIIYVSRNPKDACISYYHFYPLYTGYVGTFEHFCKLFLANKILHTPYWTNVNSYLKRNDDNMMCIKFEDMKNDLRSALYKVSTFLGKILNEEQMKKLQDHLSFTCMKKKPSVNNEAMYAKYAATKLYGETFTFEKPFIRSGQVGEWKSMMSKELVKGFDDWIEGNS